MCVGDTGLVLQDGFWYNDNLLRKVMYVDNFSQNEHIIHPYNSNDDNHGECDHISKVYFISIANFISYIMYVLLKMK